MNKSIQNINLTQVIVATILGIAIVGYGGFNYIAKQNQLAFEKQQRQKEEEVNTIQRKSGYYKEVELDKCLAEADKEYYKLRELNSFSDPKENHPNAMQWNSPYVKEQTEKKRLDDKKLCADLYGSIEK